MPSFIQPSFAKGEIGPALYGRVDTAAYQVALRTALNTVIHTHGGISNRPGLQFIAPCKDHTTEPVLIDFQFKDTDTYVLEFGNLYVRFIRNDAQILEDTINIIGIDNSVDPAKVHTATQHGYTTGDHVFIASAAPTTQINGRWYHVTKTDELSFTLKSVYDGGIATIDPDTSGGESWTVGTSATNLCLQSEVLGTTWTNDLAGGITLAANATAAPDGATTADSIKQVNNVGDGIQQANITLTASTKYHHSVFVKNIDATASTVIIYDTNATATLASLKIAWTGAVPSTSASAAASDITYTSIGNSWYRVSFSFTTASSVSTHKVQYQPETTDTATQGIYAWGAQVEIGDTPTQYIPTTTGAVTETNYQTAGTTGKVYEVVTPYLTADLPQLKWTQSADVLTLTHSSYSVRELTRTGHNTWTITEPTFAPSISAPTAVTQTVDGSDNDVNWKYKVTAIKGETFEESLAGLGADLPNTASAATAANPVVITSVAHDLITGDEVEITGFTQMTEVNGRRFTITKVDADNFSLQSEDGTDYTAESTGGSDKVYPTFDVSGTQAAPTGTTIPENTITWAAVTDAVKYTIYRAEGGKADYGFLAETSELTFTDHEDAKQSTDTSITPPAARNPFRVAGEYPAAVSYYQQRRVFGGSTNEPDTTYYSQTGNQSNFSTSRPIQADDAITATLNSRQVNQIRHFIPQSDLLVLTDGAEWRVNSGENSGFSADTLKQEPQTSWGANHLKPFVAGQIVLYMQENNIAVRSLGYQLSLDGYTGTDLTLLAPQIFGATTAVSWGFARSPDPVVHVVKADGDVAIMTFNEEQEVLAWSRWHTRNGLFKWCTAMRPSATEVNDAAYFIVERVINSNTVLFIERVASRRFTDVQDAFFVDSGLSLNAPIPLAITTVAHRTAVLADPVVLQATAHGFSDGDLIDIEGMVWTPAYDSDENETQPDQLNGRRYRICDKTTNAFTLGGTQSDINIIDITDASPGEVETAEVHGLTSGDKINLSGIDGMTQANNNVYTATVTSTKKFTIGVDTNPFSSYTNGGTVHNAEDGSAFVAYVRGGNARKAVTTVAGLNHLEGESVIILADGNVIDGKSVSIGAITLSTPASRIHVGIQVVADIETLDVEAPEGTIQGKRKKLTEVTVRFEKSRGLLIGPNKDLLVEMKQRENEPMGAPTTLLTGDKRITLKPSWNSNGRLLLRQVNPLPMTILAIVPDLQVGD